MVDVGKLTRTQAAFLRRTPWHLEAFPNDGRRLRIVYPGLKTTSRWFSTEWRAVPWEFVKPRR